MTFRFLIWVFCSFCAGDLAAVPGLQTGLVFEDAVYDTLKELDHFEGNYQLPGSMDLRPYCPYPKHQGTIMSCVGWAVGYGAMTIQRAVINNCTDRDRITREAYSALFVYNHLNGGSCGQGTRISDALKFVARYGNCTAREFDQNVQDCQKRADEQLFQRARMHQIQDFRKVFERSDPAEEKIRKVKSLLARKRPVIVGMQIFRNFYYLQNINTWYPTVGNQASAGGHAMVVVGFDDQRQAFLLLNSWGSSWGMQGFIWIRYRDFSQYCKYGFVLFLLSPPLLKNSEDVLSLSAGTSAPMVQKEDFYPVTLKMEIRYFNQFRNFKKKPTFQNLELRLAGDRYVTEQPYWYPDQLFKLEATSWEGRGNIYLLIVDPKHQCRLAGSIQNKTADKSLVEGAGVSLVVDGMDPFKLSDPGTHFLIFIYSARPVNDLKGLAEILQNSTEAVPEMVHSVLGNYTLPADRIHYFSNFAGFEAKVSRDKYMVPVIVALQIGSTP